MRATFEYLRPRTIDEALAEKARRTGSRFLAGGTDLLIAIKDGKEHPPAIVSLRSIPELRGVRSNGALRIGAGTPIADCLADERLTARFPVLAQAMARMGSVQIRNVATVGGNLCTASPCADTAPPLLVLGASVTVRDAANGRPRQLPLDDFFRGPRRTAIGPHELVTEIVVPPMKPGARAVFLKKTRVAMDLALASVAVLLELDGAKCTTARIAAGSVAPTPRRLTDVEKLLEGRAVTPDVIARAGELARDAVAPICDLRAGADYRRHVTGVFVRAAIEQILGGRRP